MRKRKEPGKMLRRVMRRFEAWRRSPTRRKRIPPELWGLAVEAARAEGVSPASHRLGLDYSGLKRRMKATRGPRASRPRRRDPKPQFVEVPQQVLSSGPICAVELSDAGGRRLRIEYRKIEAPQIESVARMLWSAPR